MNDIQKEILNNKDTNYCNFASKIVPSKQIYLRVPVAKKIAKKYAQTSEGMDFLSTLPHESTDEYIVHGLMIGHIKDVDITTKLLEQFLPYIDNWATCDMTCSNLKIVKKYPNLYEKLVKKWLKSEKFFVKRFAIVILLSYFLDDFFDEKHLDLVNFTCENYYVKMAQSWYYSVALVKKYEAIIKLFENSLIKDKWVLNKSIQKACESYRMTDEKKHYLKNFKI